MAGVLLSRESFPRAFGTGLQTKIQQFEEGVGLQMSSLSFLLNFPLRKVFSGSGKPVALSMGRGKGGELFAFTAGAPVQTEVQ